MEMHLLFPRRYYSLYRLITSGLEKNDVAGNLSGTCFNVASVTPKVLVSVFPFSVLLSYLFSAIERRHETFQVWWWYKERVPLTGITFDEEITLPATKKFAFDEKMPLPSTRNAA